MYSKKSLSEKIEEGGAEINSLTRHLSFGYKELFEPFNRICITESTRLRHKFVYFFISVRGRALGSFLLIPLTDLTPPNTIMDILKTGVIIQLTRD